MIIPCIAEQHHHQQLQAPPTPTTSTHDGSDSAATAVVAPSYKCGSTSDARPNMAPADAHQAAAGHKHSTAPPALRDSGQLQQQHPPSLQAQQQVLVVSGDEGIAPPSHPQLPELQAPAKVAAPTAGGSVDQQQQLEQQTDSSGDDSWTPGQQQSSADMDCEQDQEELWHASRAPASYCTNCTALLYSYECSDCGHSSENDAALFECVSLVSSQPMEAAASGGRPVLVWDDAMLLHEEGRSVPHPERPDRLRAIMGRLTGSGVAGHCERVPARAATEQELLRVHTADHLRRLQLFCSGTAAPTSIPSDTYINQHTLDCAALAAGSAAEVAVRVVQGQASCGAAIIRPPGHHAESNTAMGFCFFNNAAVAARAAQEAGAERVLILDWDVHHGNGTQHIFEADPSVLYMSLHRYDRGNFYPGTGAADEAGFGRGAGYTVNVPWDAGNIGNGDYLAAMQQVLLPIAREFAPSLIVISAGFDAADGDPIGGCRLTPDCFAAMTAQLMDVAPTALLLEGGYNLLSTAISTEACLRVLLGDAPEQLSSPRPSPFGWLAIQAAKKVHSRYWSCLAGAFPQLHQQASLLQRLEGFDGSGTGSSSRVYGQLEYGDEYEEEEYVDDNEEEEDEDGDEQGQEEEEQEEGGQAAMCGSAWGANRDSHTGQSDAAAATAMTAGRASDGDAHSSRRRQQLHQCRRRQHGLSRKQQILRAIHKRAMAIFWRRRFRHSGSQQLASRMQQQQR